MFWYFHRLWHHSCLWLCSQIMTCIMCIYLLRFWHWSCVFICSDSDTNDVYIFAQILTPMMCIYLLRFWHQWCVYIYSDSETDYVYIIAPILTPMMCMYLLRFWRHSCCGDSNLTWTCRSRPNVRCCCSARWPSCSRNSTAKWWTAPSSTTWKRKRRFASLNFFNRWWSIIS